MTPELVSPFVPPAPNVMLVHEDRKHDVTP